MQKLNLSDLEISLEDIENSAHVFERHKLRLLRKKSPWVLDLIKELWPHENGLHRSHVIKALEKRRDASGLPTPKTFEATVQSAYNRYSRDSTALVRKNRSSSEDLFYSPMGKYSGNWAVDRVRAAAWMTARNIKGPHLS
jgi:hypothetical protein